MDVFPARESAARFGTAVVMAKLGGFLKSLPLAISFFYFPRRASSCDFVSIEIDCRSIFLQEKTPDEIF